MTGTLLAVIFAPVLTLAVGFALLAQFGVIKQKDAPKTPKPRATDYVTREELDEAIEKYAKALEWEWTEMYDKFSKLHLRLTKRDQRRKQEQQELEDPQIELGEGTNARPSVLRFRKLGP